MSAPRFASLFLLACAGTCVSSYAILTEPVGTSSSPQTATVTITTAGTLETISVLTQGAIGLDFNAASGGTCSVGHAYAVGSTCTVNYTFKPTRPWTRYGGIALFDGAGNLLGNMYLTGTGTGPQTIFPSNSSPTTLADFHSFISPYGAAVGGGGNLYVTDSDSDQVVEIVAVNGRIPTNPTIRILSSGFFHPYGVAVDGSGNVYVVDGLNSQIKELVAVNGSVPANPAIRILGSGFLYPYGVAVDGSGNVYVADGFNNAVKEIAAVNGVIPANPSIRTLSSDFHIPVSVAVDGSGNVFVTYVEPEPENTIAEIVAVNGSIPPNPTIRTLGNGFDFNNPAGVAVDGSGNLYIADTGNNAIKEMVAVDGMVPGNPTIITLAGGYLSPQGVALDGSGNVFVADPGNSRVVELNRADPPSLDFGVIHVGFTSSSQTVTLENDGNATLTGSSLSVSPNWDQIAGSGTPEDCTASFSLVPGAECNLRIIFEPAEGGTLNGAAIFTDNALNVAGTTQEVSLAGLAQAGHLTVSATALSFGNLALGQQKDLQLQVTNNETLPVTFATVINGPSFTVPPAENGCRKIPAGHSCILSVRFLPRTYGGHVDTLTFTGPGVVAPTVQLTSQTLGVGAEVGLLDFGTIPYGSPAILYVPMVNYGVSQNVTFSTSINESSFQILTAGNTCLSGVTAAQQCVIPVEFPTTYGNYAGVLTITASSGDVSLVKLNGAAD